MRKLTCIVLLAAALGTQIGCDDVLEDFRLGFGYYNDPGYCWSCPGDYYGDTYVEEYWYEETYYEDSWYFDPWDTWFW